MAERTTHTGPSRTSRSAPADLTHAFGPRQLALSVLDPRPPRRGRRRRVRRQR